MISRITNFIDMVPDPLKVLIPVSGIVQNTGITLDGMESKPMAVTGLWVLVAVIVLLITAIVYMARHFKEREINNDIQKAELLSKIESLYQSKVESLETIIQGQGRVIEKDNETRIANTKAIEELISELRRAR